MRVLFIDVNCKYSSTGKIVYDLFTELNSNGHTAAVCYGRGPLINEPNIYKFSSNLEVYAHAFLTRLTGLTGCYSFFATHNLIKFMEEFKPDVVHIHDLYAYFVNIAPVINYLKKNNMKTVWTFHGEMMYTGKCGHTYECEKWKTECGKCPQVKQYPSSLLFDFTRKMFKEKKVLFNGFNNLAIVTPSKWLADRVKQSFLGDRDIRVIHNGIDTTNFQPLPAEYLRIKHNLTDEKVFIYVTHNFDDVHKGGNYILELAYRLIGEHVKIFIIGNRNPLKNAPANIIAIGRTKNQRELAAYYSMADLCLLTSSKETFSMVCAESLCCGTPICGFEAGAPSEIAPEGYGLFVPCGDISSLVDVVKSILRGEIKLNSKEECARFGKENYDKAVMAKNYMSLYLK